MADHDCGGRKINAMHAHFGTCEGVQCKGCRHLISGEWHDRRYHKCELYGLSHSEATDWRLSYQACGMYNMHVKRGTWMPVIERLRYSPKSPEPSIDGQVRMEGL